jgi:xanthine dehydrogenase small subunit
MGLDYCLPGRKMISFICNNELITADCEGGLPLLDWIRSRNGMKGTKEGCREGDCGACTVILGKPGSNGIEYSTVCSCLLPAGEVHGCHLVTIEGLSSGEELTPFQRAFYDEAASQCGFCTPGMIMSLTGCLLGAPLLSVKAAMESLDGNICRCTGYTAVKRAVEFVMKKLPEQYENRIDMLVSLGHIPPCFTTISKRLELIPPNNVTGCDAVVAGGTDIYIHSGDELALRQPVFLSKRENLNFILRNESTIRVGASVTAKQLKESPVISNLFPGLKDFLGRVSSTQIRSRATLGGNLVNASPIADLAIVFLALNSSVTFSTGRLLPLCDFYLGYKHIDLQPGEILTEISFPVPEPGSVLTALKVCKREYLDIASVNSAMLLLVENGIIRRVSLSAGGVAPFPLLLRRTASYLSGREISPATIQAACSEVSREISPISDVRGSREYKDALLKAQLKAHLTREQGV